MMFNDVTKMVVDLTNQLSPILVGLNVALVLSARRSSSLRPWTPGRARWDGSYGVRSPSTARSWRANRLCCSAINSAAGAPRSRQ